MRIRFTLPGKPVAQGRPRFYRKGKFVVATDPKPSKVYKADIAYIAQRAREEAGIEGLFEGPLGMETKKLNDSKLQVGGFSMFSKRFELARSGYFKSRKSAKRLR